MLISTSIATVSGLRLFVALFLSLALAAAVSLVLLRISTGRRLELGVEPKSVRLIKRRKAVVSLSITGARRGWFEFNSAVVRSGAQIQIQPVEIGFFGGKFLLTGVFAGRYEGLTLEMGLLDVLGLFKMQKKSVLKDFVAEVLPMALLNPPPVLLVGGVSDGDTSGGGRGSGQELYGIEDYNSQAEVRDIVWKRVASSPDERVLARIRESNVPSLVRLALVEGRGGDETAWMDLASESVAQLGVALIAIGIALEVTLARGSQVRRLIARSPEELAELTVSIWDHGEFTTRDRRMYRESDLLIVGSSALGDEEVRGSMAVKPSIVIKESDGPVWVGPGDLVFTGDEDLRGVIGRVLAR